METEIRFFGSLRELCMKRGWPFPYIYPLQETCTPLELARRLELPLEQIEAAFVNNKTVSLEDGQINPGDRVAFVPQGTPGVCRLLLGIKRN
jgi:molybdopterin converting factor small subunit